MNEKEKKVWNEIENLGQRQGYWGNHSQNSSVFSKKKRMNWTVDRYKNKIEI